MPHCQRFQRGSLGPINASSEGGRRIGRRHGGRFLRVPIPFCFALGVPPMKRRVLLAAALVAGAFVMLGAADAKAFHHLGGDCGCCESSCGCESTCSAAPSCAAAAPSCGCSAAPSCGCDSCCDSCCDPCCHKCKLFGWLHKCCHKSCCCEKSCGCESTCSAAPSCGCSAAPSCGCAPACDSCCEPCCGHKCHLFGWLHKCCHKSCCDCCESSCCAAPSCGCSAAPSCGCGG
jgi:hypothetical protein